MFFVTLQQNAVCSLEKIDRIQSTQRRFVGYSLAVEVVSTTTIQGDLGNTESYENIWSWKLVWT